MKKILLVSPYITQGVFNTSSFLQKKYSANTNNLCEFKKLMAINTAFFEKKLSLYLDIKKMLSKVDSVYFYLPFIFDNTAIDNYLKNLFKAINHSQHLKTIVFDSSSCIPNIPNGANSFHTKLNIEDILECSQIPVIYVYSRIDNKKDSKVISQTPIIKCPEVSYSINDRNNIYKINKSLSTWFNLKNKVEQTSKCKKIEFEKNSQTKNNSIYKKNTLISYLN